MLYIEINRLIIISGTIDAGIEPITKAPLIIICSVGLDTMRRVLAERREERVWRCAFVGGFSM